MHVPHDYIHKSRRSRSEMVSMRGVVADEGRRRRTGFAAPAMDDRAHEPAVLTELGIVPYRVIANAVLLES